jgi:hypothetical protein
MIPSEYEERGKTTGLSKVSAILADRSCNRRATDAIRTGTRE